VSISAQRISDWKSGKNMPSSFETLQPVLLVLFDRARKRRTSAYGYQLLDIRAWRKLWLQAQLETRHRASPAADAPGVASGGPRLAALDGGDPTARLVDLVRRSPVGTPELISQIIHGQATVDSAVWAAADRDPALLYNHHRLTTALQHITIGRDSSAEPGDKIVLEFLRASARAHPPSTQR
jgi:hypothetical protein